MAIRFKANGIELITLAVALQVAGVDLAQVSAQRVNHFVFQDAHQPSFQLRLPGKCLGLCNGGQHGFRHCVLSPGIVAQLQTRKT